MKCLTMVLTCKINLQIYLFYTCNHLFLCYCLNKHCFTVFKFQYDFLLKNKSIIYFHEFFLFNKAILNQMTSKSALNICI